ncbi:T1SS-143 domain-containing protein/type I secretion C-terminal target domain (VC_A0849 subclass) [Desulfomicrobium norvegicum]|uniref:T1SS-143 domain-containing protein/type I secretion C-terminal target domain (VC_A0849 subclass) n=1 Tax=Desulfomicrobium norvegicum (strain DSM 1741 / NCIMB 8310) TaxID=52561 RepID=A0A8G2C0M2_DESNO|nr:VWA domain-containing protein [Desulfomicrobium norvegicum]SFL35781.1 T1SS-143 domain-containing protein/type I secretion C-terminal target domain (VC_A0849 subclass) [Desulfomicrobium norvegicum]
MAETTQGTKLSVRAPEAGQSVIVSAIPGQDIVLDSAFDQAEPKMSDNNVVFEFADGGQVVIEFSDIPDGQVPNIILADGTVLNLQEFLASLSEGDVEPAAGPEGGATGSGGVGEYRDDAGNLIDGVDKLGGLDPRDFTAITVEALEADVEDLNPLPSAGLAFGAADEDGLRVSELTMTPFDGNDDGADGDHPAQFAYAEGVLNYDFGGDGPSATTPFVWSLAGLVALGVESRGNELQYEVVDGGTTLNAFYITEYPNGEYDNRIESLEPVRVDVFSLQVTDLAAGTYRFELYQPLDHSVSGTEDDILYNFSFTLTDGSGDSVVGGLNMIVDDDSPVATDAAINRTVDEDDIKTWLSDGNHPNDGNHDGSFTGDPYKWWDSGPANIKGSLASLVVFGADGPGEGGFSLSEDVSGLVAQNLYSKGEPLSYRVEGSTLIAYVGIGEPEGPGGDEDVQVARMISLPQERVVFTLELDSDGEYTFNLYDQLDHPVGDGQNNLPIDLASVIVATDGDGDAITLTGGFTINVTDDVPEQDGIFPVLKIVEEEMLPNGNQEENDFSIWGRPVDGWPDTKLATGSLASQVSFGADEDGTFSMLPDTSGLPELTSGGIPVTYLVEGNVLTATAGEVPVFTLTLQSDGHFSFLLQGPLDHAPGGGENLLLLDMSSIVKATDADGDSITLDKDFYIKIVDDMPTVDIDLNIGLEQQVLGAVVTDETSQLGVKVTGAESIFAYTVAPAAGADGGTPDVSLRIDDSATGFKTTVGGHLITLVADPDDNNVVYGKYTDGSGTHDAFTIEIGEDGKLSVTQHVAMVHPDPATLEGNPADTLSYDEAITLANKLSAVVTLEDGDKDVAMDAVGIGAFISFKDDGPAVDIDLNIGLEQQVLGAVVTDETSQLGVKVTGAESIFAYTVAPAAGADGGTPDVSLRIDDSATGFKTTVGGHLITLVADPDDNNVVYGKYTDGSGTHDAFTIEIGEDGKLSVTQHVAMVHPDPATLEGNPADTSSYDEAITLANKLSAVVTLEDGDQDVAMDAVGIGAFISFKDDGPTLTSIEPATLLNDPDAQVTGTSDLAMGVDLPGSADLSWNVSGWDGGEVVYSASALTAGGETVYYYVDPEDTSILFAYTSEIPGVYTNGVDQELIFTLTFDVATGQYSIVMDGTLDASSQTFGTIFNQNIGANEDYLLLTDAGKLYKPGSVIPSTERVITTVDSSTGGVNASQQGLGVGNQFVDGAEAIYFFYEGSVEAAQFSIDIQGGEATNEVSWTAYGTNSEGVITTETGVLVFSEGIMTGIPTTLSNLTRIDLSDTGGNGFRVTATEIVEKTVDLPVNTVFTVAVADADGDVAMTNLSVQFDPKVSGTLIVGSADDDIGGSSSVYTVPAAGDGSITGNAGGDILVGDPGGATLVPGTVANIVLVLDNSGSMSGAQLNGLKAAVANALNGLKNSQAKDVQVHIVKFGTNAESLGTFMITSNGVDNLGLTGLEGALLAVNGMTAGMGWTNYEAALVKANQWIESSAPLENADLNKVIFVSDGEPNRALNNSGEVVSVSAADAMRHVLGDIPGDSKNEVDLIESPGPGGAQGFTIEAVGISVNQDALTLLSQLEGAGGAATNVTSAEELNDVIGELTGASTVSIAAGDDIVMGNAGDDIIFGDVLFTDVLATAAGLNVAAGSGWLVFEQLEAGMSTVPGFDTWDRAQTLDYIRNNHATLSQESGREGGNDMLYGGAGNDIIHGQEGDDFIVGGTGNDTMSGGAGQDTFSYAAGDVPDGAVTGDTILDFELGPDGDTLDLSALLSGTSSDPLDYVNITGALGLDGKATVDVRIDQDGAGGDYNTHVATITVTGVGADDSIDDVINTMITNNINI